MKEETKRAIDGLIEDAVHDGTTAGALFAVTEDGRETFYTEHGYARIEEEKPMTRDCLFRMFSMTKPVTAVAAMVLMEKGMLDLGQPVKELIPGCKQHCQHHSCSFPSHFFRSTQASNPYQY